ncbi:MAG: aromatic ring-hydroxylating dioxygenase subunit alpha [Actinomycetota bacterium]
MRIEMDRAIGDELLALARAGSPPADRPSDTLHVDVYTDRERHRLEVAAIAAHPVPAVAESEVTEPGSFATAELAGVPIIITRDRDGQLHAMRNVCAHRGATVVTEAAGTSRIFSCGFHGWSYNLDGSLRAVADKNRFSSVEPCTTGLRRLTCEARHGMVWVTPDPDVAQASIADWLGPELDELLTELGLPQMVHHAVTEYDLACNWKLLTDGFMELYHLKYLHRNSIAPYFPNDLTLNKRLGEHFVGWLPKNRLLRMLDEQPRDEWRVVDGCTGAFTLVPGTVIQWQAGHVELFSLRPHPTEPNRTVCRLTMLVPEERAHETELWDRNWERVCITIPDEDFAAAVDVQRNIDAGAVDVLQIGFNEHKLVDHLSAIDQLINA